MNTLTLSRARCLLLLVAVSLLSLTSAAQERRTIVVRVLDKGGKLVEGLTASNFRADFRGQSVDILSARLDRSPRHILLIVDVRAGMKFGHNWKFAWAAASDLVRALSSGHWVAVVTLGGRAEQRAVFIRDPQRVLEILEETQARARKERPTTLGLARGMSQIVESFSPAEFEYVIYLITNSGYSGGRALIGPHFRLEEPLARASLHLFAVWLESPIGGPRGRLFRGDPQGLKRLAEHSGGGFVMVRSSVKLEDISHLVRPLYAAMTHVYRLEVQFPRAINKPRSWKLEVVSEQGTKRKDVTLAYPHLLVPLSDFRSKD